jgi:hypothetical protein
MTSLFSFHATLDIQEIQLREYIYTYIYIYMYLYLYRNTITRLSQGKLQILK